VDRDFIERLHGQLEDAGLRVWLSTHDLKGGRKLDDQLEQAIRLHDKLLLVLSEASIESDWVRREILRARRRERSEGRQILFPITLVPYEALKGWEYLDADTGEDVARVVREFYIPDFSQWKDPATFDDRLAALVHDLTKQP
jgi:TIR domain